MEGEKVEWEQAEGAGKEEAADGVKVVAARVAAVWEVPGQPELEAAACARNAGSVWRMNAGCRVCSDSARNAEPR
jgi:hypothetical protein